MVYPNNQKIIKKIEAEFKRQPSEKNLVIATEHLIGYQTIHNGNIFKMFSKWTNVTTPEIVVHMRSPRTEQLVSLWKQNTQYRSKKTKSKYYGWSFRQFMCSEGSAGVVSKGLRLTLNPIGLADDLIHKHGLPTYVVDMKGVAEQNLDICHVFACSILRANCTDGNKWVRGVERDTIHANARMGDPAVSDNQFEEMEQLFRQRDCAYGVELSNHPLFHFHYPHVESWPHQCSNVQAAPSYRDNSTLLLHAFRKVLKCPGFEHYTEPISTELVVVSSILDLWSYIILSIYVLVSCFLKRRRRLKAALSHSPHTSSNLLVV
eukprot:scaffold15718_cov126-Cylindrotheca_fusiformis.AAC.1